MNSIPRNFTSSLPAEFNASRSAAEIFSVPLEVLRDPSFRGQYAWKRAGELAHFPAILYGGQTIWGLTLRITETMLQLLGKPNL